MKIKIPKDNSILIGGAILLALPGIATLLNIPVKLAVLLLIIISSIISYTITVNRKQELKTKHRVVQFLLDSLYYISTLLISFHMGIYILVRGPLIDYLKDNYFTILNTITLLTITWLVTNIFLFFTRARNIRK